MPFVRVAVNLPAVSGEYDYHLPDALAGVVGAGHLVTVPFGTQVAQGVVLEIVSQPAAWRYPGCRLRRRCARTSASR